MYNLVEIVDSDQLSTVELLDVRRFRQLILFNGLTYKLFNTFRHNKRYLDIIKN